MSRSDAVGLILFTSLGLWWAISPQSAINFYSWFHRGKTVPTAKPAVVRIVGVLRVAFIVLIAIFVVRR